MKRLIRLYLILFPLFVHAATLKDIALQGKNHTSIITLKFSHQIPYKYFQLTNPSRIVFDFDNISSHAPLKSKSYTRLIKSIRFGRQQNNHLRLVIDVKHRLNVHVTGLKKHNDYIINVQLKHPSNPKTTTQKKIAQKNLRDVIVVIDPGHGGKDPGAVGRRGYLEKKIVLQIAKRLQRVINLTPGMQARLTRRGDYYIGLRQRLQLARKHKADIFVSIHADAFKNRTSQGVSVFALSQRGATSEAARWLAEKENYSELGGVDLSGLKDENGLVRSVLIDLSQTATIGASLKLGSQLLRYLDDLASLHHDKVEQARFVVLKSPDIPSVLIETGFISNYREEALLASPWYQNKLASKILNGLKHYFSQYPPRGTYFEQKRKRYRVAKGDTLSVIAKRNRLTLKELKEFNRLTSNEIRVGQLLMLPVHS